jgi:large subunit ribosomal protein L17
LNRTSAHRKALHRNLAQSLIEHGSVRTTLPKAKDLRPVAERIITLALRARNGDSPAKRLTARRALHQILADRAVIPAEHRDSYDGLPSTKRNKTLTAPSGRRFRTGQPKGKLDFTAQSVMHRLINDVAPRFEGRRGGYTRIVRLPTRRVGDHTSLALVQLVGDEKSPGSVAKAPKTARRKRNDARYAMAAKVLKAAGKAAARSAPESAGE